jgi:hypothetical protein
MPTQTNLIQEGYDQESIYARKRRVFTLVQNGSIGAEVLSELLPGGQPHLFEKSLWDYKEDLPVPTPGASQSQLDAHSAKMAEIVKDVVSFYNTFGGYLIAGVKDNPRTLVGFQGQFDCGDLAKKVKGGHTAFNWLPLRNHTDPFRRRVGRRWLATHSSAPR